MDEHPSQRIFSWDLIGLFSYFVECCKTFDRAVSKQDEDDEAGNNSSRIKTGRDQEQGQEEQEEQNEDQEQTVKKFKARNIQHRKINQYKSIQYAKKK